MKLPANYFENLSNSKYRQYLKLLPDIRKENTRLATTLILTFVALSFFGIFAINPTLTTIIELQKQLEDSEFTHQQLTTKITNLSTLQQKYTNLNADLQVLENAIPKEAAATKLTGQIHTLAADSKLTIRNLRVAEVTLTSGKTSNTPKGLSYVFNVEASGTYEQMLFFADTLTKFSRIVTVEAISVGRDTRTQDLVLNIRGRQYFKP
jgi:Tfp pilus assembly protein PilO